MKLILLLLLFALPTFANNSCYTQTELLPRLFPFSSIEQIYLDSLKSVNKLVDQACKSPSQNHNGFCHFDIFHKMFLSAKSYLDVNSTSSDGTIRMNRDAQPSNFYADLLGLNWHFDYFTPQKSHTEIIHNIVLLEYSSRAIELLTQDLKEYLQKI